MTPIREYLHTLEEEVLLLEPASMDAAITGLVSRADGLHAVCYDTQKVIEVLIAEGMAPEDAEEFFDFNIAGAYLGANTPVFLDRALPGF